MKNHEGLCLNHKCERKDACDRYVIALKEHRHTGNFNDSCDKHNDYHYFRKKEENK